MRLRCSIWSISVFVMLAGLGWFLHPLSANAQEVTTVAGDGTSGFADGTGTSAKFNRPFGVAVQGHNLFVSDRRDNLGDLLSPDRRTYPYQGSLPT